MAKIKQGKKCQNVGDKAEKVPEGAPGWMATYGDMVTLLLTFFVMLFTTATNVDESRLQLIATAFSGAFGVMSGGMTLSPGELMYMGHNVKNLPSSEKGTSAARKRKVASFIHKAKIQSKHVRVTEDERGFVISLSADFFFRPGSAEFIRSKEATKVLSFLVDLFSSLPNEIRFEGHTDDEPIGEDTKLYSDFESNWELSTQRAINTLKAVYSEDVRGKLVEKRTDFSVAGFADTRPIANNDRPEGRAVNRRVDIVIVRDDVNFYNQR